jgi:hypothetical protein
MADPGDRTRAVVSGLDRTIGPARSLAERTLAYLAEGSVGDPASQDHALDATMLPLATLVMTVVRGPLEHLVDDNLRTIYALVFEIDGKHNYYVQCALDNEGLLVEAVSDAYLPYPGDEIQLSREQIESLARLGWGAADAGENYGRYFPVPFDLEAIAALIVTTLADVYGLRDVHDLVVKEVER